MYTNWYYVVWHLSPPPPPFMVLREIWLRLYLTVFLYSAQNSSALLNSPRPLLHCQPESQVGKAQMLTQHCCYWILCEHFHHLAWVFDCWKRFCDTLLTKLSVTTRKKSGYHRTIWNRLQEVILFFLYVVCHVHVWCKNKNLPEEKPQRKMILCGHFFTCAFLLYVNTHSIQCNVLRVKL